MPVLDQSVAWQVGLDLSKMRTPSSISSIITDLDSSNSSLSSLSHLKGVPGLSNWRRGSMSSVAAKAYNTWFMSPNQERTSVMFVGVGEVAYNIKRVFLAWSYIGGGDFEASKFNSVWPKYKIVRVEDDAIVAADVKPLNCLGELKALGEIVGPEKCVINAFGLVRDVGDNLIKSSGVAITSCYVSLGCRFVLVSHPWGNEGGEVAVVWVKGNTVVAVPTVEDSLLSATGYVTVLMEWALCVVSFAFGMEVECLEIHCPPGFAIFLRADHHAVAPGHWFTHWYWLKDT